MSDGFCLRGLTETKCAWCTSDLPATKDVGFRGRRRFCGQRCRQAAFRLRRSSETLEATSTPLVFAYADPPYPGFARKYYREFSRRFKGGKDDRITRTGLLRFIPARAASRSRAHRTL